MDFRKFEQLSGIELGMFVSHIVKQGEVDDSIMTYHRSHAAALDGQHIEMMIFLLGKLGTPVALNEVASFLDHPTKYIRYQAAQVIANAPSLDENAMAKVVKVLANPPYPQDITQIKNALDHGGTELAQAIANSFRKERG
jgi:HEAT repeat protein